MSIVTHITKAMTVTASAGVTQAFNTSVIANGGMLIGYTISKPAASGLGTGTKITLTNSNSSMLLAAVTATGSLGTVVSYWPRAQVQTVSGEAMGYTSAATPPGIPDRLPIGAGEAIHIVVASATGGGTPNSASGGLNFTMDFYLTGI